MFNPTQQKAIAILAYCGLALAMQGITAWLREVGSSYHLDARHELGLVEQGHGLTW